MCKGIKWVSLIAVVSLILVLLPVIGCQAKTVPAGAKPIKIGIDVDLSGPLSALEKHILQATQDYFAFLNEKGGINGAQIEVLWGDDEYAVAKGVELYKKFRSEGIVAYSSGISSAVVQLKPVVESDKIPLVFYGGNDWAMYPAGWVWSTPAPYAHTAAGLIDWFMQKRWTNPKPPKVVLGGQDNDYGHINEFAIPYLKDKWGIDFYPTFIVCPPTAVDLTAQALIISRENADILITHGTPASDAVLAKALFQLQLKNKVTIVNPWGGWTTETVYPKTAGIGATDGTLTAGVYGLPWWGINLPGIEPCLEYQKKIRGTASDQAFYYCGWAHAIAIGAGIKGALDKKGYPITGADVQEALKTINVSGMGIVKSLKGDINNRWLSNEMMVCEYKGGKVVPQSDWITPPNLQAYYKDKHPEMLEKIKR